MGGLATGFVYATVWFMNHDLVAELNLKSATKAAKGSSLAFDAMSATAWKTSSRLSMD